MPTEGPGHLHCNACIFTFATHVNAGAYSVASEASEAVAHVYRVVVVVVVGVYLRFLSSPHRGGCCRGGDANKQNFKDDPAPLSSKMLNREI